MATVKFRPKLRLMVLVTMLGIGLLAVTVRLVWVQGVASNSFAELAAAQRERRFVLPAQRGSIYDRDRAELAMSMNRESVFADPAFIRDPVDAATKLAPILGIDQQVIQDKLQSKGRFVYLGRKLEEDLVAQVMSLELPGISTIDESKRVYPAGNLASHLVGFVGVDNQGLAGLESLYDDTLKGTPGEVLLERDPQGRAIPAGKSQFFPPTAGEDLILTIDREIQFVAERALRKVAERFGAKGGSLIVMDPRTGEILAMTNYPSFNPNDALSSPQEARRNRAVSDVFEPGSTSKVITAAAALELGVVKPTDSINVPDSIGFADERFSDYAPHPTYDLSFSQVIQHSSNVGTIKVALKLGSERLYEYLRKFGYGSSTGLEFPGQSAGLLKPTKDWWATSLPTIAIGQGVAVTPLQLVNVYSTVANGGIAVEPHLLRARMDQSGQIREAPVAEKRRVIKDSTARQLTEILTGVVEFGTGSPASIDGYQVAGKTGSAEKAVEGQLGYSGFMSSFIGFAPAGEPRLVIGVVLDDPRPIWGSVTAAPAFKEVMQFSLRHLGIGPGPVLRSEGTPLPALVRSGGFGASTPPATPSGGAGAATD